MPQLFELASHMIDGFPKNGPSDPIEYYRKPFVGRLYLDRINRGLRLLPNRRYARELEVGYGAGAVQVALRSGVDELYGIDLDAEPSIVHAVLKGRGCDATLAKGSVYELPYESEFFDLVVCFSVFEHLAEYKKALAEVYRVLRPGGLFLLGMPSVNKLMEAGFLAIGFKGINDHHITRPADVERAWPSVGFQQRAADFLDLPRPFGLRSYHDWLLEKPLGRVAPTP
ncbi:MAG: methyltransferase domain-containing protein [Myxococcales bacterium]